MHNNHDDMIKFHNDEVTLSNDERSEMRRRRDANRDRLKKGLKDKGKPAPIEFRSQGSYAMKTMVQDDDNDYDIDDGAYFEKDGLVGERGGEMTALQARQMVRDAIDDGSFTKAPEVRKHCVRVYYKAGFHVDIPVYRQVEVGSGYEYELASTDWKKSDARDVTDWFKKENKRQSPDTSNGRQLRRIVRMLKKLARSRDSWKGRILSGFGITKLVTEEFRPNINREDEALYNTMKAIRDRLNWDLEVAHPIAGNGNITSGPDDARSKYLRERLTEVLDYLEPLFKKDCTRKEARKAWDKAFNTDFFTSLEPTDSTKAEVSTISLLSEGLVGQAVPESIQKHGGGKYA